MNDLKSYITDRNLYLEKTTIKENFEFTYSMVHRNFNLNMNVLKCFTKEFREAFDEEYINDDMFGDVIWYDHLQDYMDLSPEEIFMFVFHSILGDAKLQHFITDDMYLPSEGMEEDEISEIVEGRKESIIYSLEDSNITCKQIITELVEFIDQYYDGCIGEDSDYFLLMYCVSSEILYTLIKNEDYKTMLYDFLGDVSIINDDINKVSYIYCGWLKPRDYSCNDFVFSEWDELNKLTKKYLGLEYSFVPSLISQKIRIFFSNNFISNYGLIEEIIKAHETKEEVMF